LISLLAYRTVKQYGRLLASVPTVHLSVRLSVMLYIVALGVGRGAESYTVVFLGRHFLFTSLDPFAVGCIVQPQHTAKNRTAEISASGRAVGSAVTWSDAVFSAVRDLQLYRTSYAVRSAFSATATLLDCHLLNSA